MPINLVGPNPAQPFDIQTQQAQLALQQQLAMALLQQEMGPTNPTIRTAAGNPFGRDVVNLAPVGNVIASALTRQHLGDINQQQQDLANTLLARRLQSFAEAGAPVTAPVPDLPGAADGLYHDVPPSLGQWAARLVTNQDPYIAGIGSSILGKQMDIEGKLGLDPGSIGRILQQVTARSLAPAVTPGPLTGAPLVSNLAALEQKPEVVKTAGGGAGTVQAVPGAQIQQAGAVAPVQPSQQPDIAAAAGLPSGTVTTEPGTGAVQVTKGPATEAAGQTLQNKIELAQNSQDKLVDFIRDTPTMLTMARLADSATKNGGNFGAHGELVNLARKVALQIGVAPDDANNITNYDTFLKFAIPAATAHTREQIGARISTIEYNSQLASMGATGDTDPRALRNIMQDRLAAGANMFNLHNNYIMPQLEAAGATPAILNAHTAPAFDPQKNLIDPLKSYGIPVNWQKDSLGMYQNMNIPAGPGSGAGTGVMGLTKAPPSGAPALGKGWTYMGAEPPQ